MNRYTWLTLAGLLLWIGETIYFGWNKLPESPQESMLDTISFMMIVWGIIGDIARNLTIQKTTNIKTRLVNYIASPKGTKKGTKK